MQSHHRANRDLYWMYCDVNSPPPPPLCALYVSIADGLDLQELEPIAYVVCDECDGGL